MNIPLIKAEKAMLELLKKEPNGLSMKELLEKLSEHKEAELRAAVWTLRASGEADFWYHEGLNLRHSAFWPPQTTIKRSSLPPF